MFIGIWNVVIYYQNVRQSITENKTKQINENELTPNPIGSPQTKREKQAPFTTQISKPNRLQQILILLFVSISVSAHLILVYFAEYFVDGDDNLLSALGIMQWILFVTFLITWYQNFRFGMSIYHIIQ